VHRLVRHQPALRLARDLPDYGHQDLLLCPALEAELPTEVPELAELAAGEAREATLHAQVDRALAVAGTDLQACRPTHLDAQLGTDLETNLATELEAELPTELETELATELETKLAT